MSEQQAQQDHEAGEAEEVILSMHMVGSSACSATAVVDHPAHLGVDADGGQPRGLPGLQAARKMGDMAVAGRLQLVRGHQRPLARPALQYELAPLRGAFGSKVESG